MAGRAGLGEVAGALDEVQAVVVAPVLDFRLADEIERADQLHAREASASWSGPARRRACP